MLHPHCKDHSVSDVVEIRTDHFENHRNQCIYSVSKMSCFFSVKAGDKPVINVLLRLKYWMNFMLLNVSMNHFLSLRSKSLLVRRPRSYRDELSSRKVLISDNSISNFSRRQCRIYILVYIKILLLSSVLCNLHEHALLRLG
jgi:hypothetical protein